MKVMRKVVDRDTALIEDFYEYLMYERCFSTKTCTEYVKEVSHFIDYYNLIHMRDNSKLYSFELKDVEGYVEVKSRTSSNSSLRWVISLLVTLSKFLRSQNLRDDVIVYDFRPRVQYVKKDYIDKETIIRLINSPNEENPIGLRDKTILYLLYSTGMRVSELVSLKINMVNFAEKKIRILGKGDKERIVLFDDTTALLLKKYISEVKPKNYIFFNSKTQRPLTIYTIEYMVRKYAKQQDIDCTITPHSLRRCFASHLCEAGVGMEQIQELLGHSSVSTTEKYVIISKEFVINSARTIINKRKCI
ncbi:tyrosine-type recombinase/integrase [Succinimonas amylolytica]|uniref:tyrosine-type recombinase/integrase n=1 Tax=Succinimonas amylolytica TaxID=83769 RepID=UPI0003816AA5|nr:tyrosine-type recombinase/integrase [Succinimonas amylolytica]